MSETPEDHYCVVVGNLNVGVDAVFGPFATYGKAVDFVEVEEEDRLNTDGRTSVLIMQILPPSKR